MHSPTGFAVPIMSRPITAPDVGRKPLLLDSDPNLPVPAPRQLSCSVTVTALSQVVARSNWHPGQRPGPYRPRATQHGRHGGCFESTRRRGGPPAPPLRGGVTVPTSERLRRSSESRAVPRRARASDRCRLPSLSCPSRTARRHRDRCQCRRPGAPGPRVAGGSWHSESGWRPPAGGPGPAAAAAGPA
jgi:hypothetical protein